jgi:hypothetical protein
LDNNRNSTTTETKNKRQKTGHVSNTNETNKTIVREFIRAPYDMKLKMITEFQDNGP